MLFVDVDARSSSWSYPPPPPEIVVVVVLNRLPNGLLLLPVVVLLVELLGVEESSGWKPSTRLSA
jgi:hypothetical protein